MKSPALRVLTLFGLGVSLGAPGAVRAAIAKPNVVFIIFDDLNDWVTGLGGHPQTRTPNFDRLMKRGVTFTNNQCNAPICAPSRPSMLTGLYPHTARFFGGEEEGAKENCPNGEEELYDHQTDPHEWTNLAGNPALAHIKQELRAAMERLVGTKLGKVAAAVRR